MKQRGPLILTLIIIALLSLLGLQMVWLFFAYRYQARELQDKTREAALATIERLQKEEDSKLILTTMDSLLIRDSVISPGKKSRIKVIVSDLKEKVNILDDGKEQEEMKQITVNGDTTVSTTVVKLDGSNRKKVIVTSETRKSSAVKEKAGELEALFLKMALRGAEKSKSESRIDCNHLEHILNEELKKRGIDLIPQLLVFNGSITKNGVTLPFKEPETDKKNGTHPGYISLPLFPGDLIPSDSRLEVFYSTTTSFLLRQMAWLLIVSTVFSALIGFTLIYIFRRMMSQEKLHRLKNDFINNMTHELKTPIATISLAIDGINHPQVRKDEAKLESYTRILKEENRKLNDHVERVLQMALLDKGELVLNKKPVKVQDLLNAAVSTHELQIRHHDAKIQWDVPAETLLVMADEFHLGNAFNNLLDNALKYSQNPCEIQIFVTTQPGEIHVSFKDNGIGMNEEEQKKIFEKFYRVQGGNLHDVKGSGLGLSYVRSVVEAHGGRIQLHSEKNKGSEFTIILKRYAD